MGAPGAWSFVSHSDALGYLPVVAVARVVPLPRKAAEPSDAELVAGARGGDPAAAEALFRRHAAMVSGLALRLMGRDEDVDDLAQESFAQAFDSLDRLKDGQAFASWIAAIVVRTVAKTIRRRRVAARLGLGRHLLAIDLDALIGPNVPADDATELRRLYALAETLPHTLRVPLLLRRVEGLPLDEIARLVGASLATVKRRVAEAEMDLRARFDRGEGRR